MTRTMKVKSSGTIDDAAIPVDLQLLFQRLLATVKRGNRFVHDDAFKYELSTIPASLFGVNGLVRKADKPTLGEAIWKAAGASPNIFPANVTYVLDGGYLLERIQNWPSGETLEDICKKYEHYVLRNYGSGTTVVFNGGYVASTKTHHKGVK